MIFRVSRIICLCLLYWFTVADITEIYSQENELSKLNFEHISKGLSQNTVTCILQDRDGFMWFGTRNGLNRYDGVLFKEYYRKLNDSIIMSPGYINCIYEDRNGILWAGSREGGLIRYHKEGDHFVSVTLENEPYLLNNSVTAIFEDSEDNFWVGTEKNGLVLYNRTTGAHTNYQHQPKDQYSLSNNQVQSIFEDKQGDLWVATMYNGLNLMDKKASSVLSLHRGI